MTLNELKSKTTSGQNRNRVKAFKELYSSIAGKDCICEEALISEHAEAILQVYESAYNRFKDKDTAEVCRALREAIISYRSDSEVQEAMENILSNDRNISNEELKNRYKQLKIAKGTKLSSFNLAVKLLKELC